MVDAIQYCNWLSDENRLEECYKRSANGKWIYDESKSGFRLPTVLEYESPHRAFSKTTFSFGSFDQYPFLNSFGLTSLSLSLQNRCTKVKSFMPNRFGIYDLTGNLAEWCWYAGTAQSQPQIHRGGNFCDQLKQLFCHEFASTGTSPGIRLRSLGFRVTLNDSAESND